MVSFCFVHRARARAKAKAKAKAKGIVVLEDIYDLILVSTALKFREF